ncbi:hypothetical protein MAR_033192 [Mya arenaria]|uniref:ShKT domain-containing protein n=3 Tax=Mya arenaria TaxID=6604 RepID=A0ABY7G8A8_MYAAR|nr:hypothetical protein MAR_033192 [Mya arenaria]
MPPPPGVTVDPCQDTGEVDCRSLNDTLNICGNLNSPPTVMYCPRFCGVCKPACADNPDVDCRKVNDTQNICALGTLSARNFCPKFCGYCGGPGMTTVVPPSAAPPCTDNPDIDCATLDATVNVCADRTNVATNIYCPKFCKIC